MREIERERPAHRIERNRWEGDWGVVDFWLELSKQTAGASNEGKFVDVAYPDGDHGPFLSYWLSQFQGIPYMLAVCP